MSADEIARANQLIDHLVKGGLLARYDVDGREALGLTEAGIRAAAVLFRLLPDQDRDDMILLDQLQPRRSIPLRPDHPRLN